MFDIAKILNYFYLFRRNLRKNTVDLFSYLFVKIYLVILPIINFFIWLGTYRIYNQTQTPQIALHYNVDFGIDLYDDVKKIFIIPLLGFLFVFINFFVVSLVNYYQRSEIKIVGHILFAAALLGNIMLLAAVISVYFINFRSY